MSSTKGRARAFHGITAVVAGFAVVLQLVLVIQGNAILDQTDPPGLATRVVRFFSYLTIWSNILVAVVALVLTAQPDRDGRVWRAVRLDAVVICFGGGIVHFFLLRPLLDLSGADQLADTLLHVVVPLFALIGWLAFGPRDRVGRGDLGPFLVIPVFWLVYTLVRGAFVDWYPYPFIDAGELGYAVIAVNAVVISLLMLGLAVVALWLDPKLPGVRNRV
ncbi:MAG: Pr6Pr family membrane protein [Ornithinimicrobium sp.]